MLSTTLADIKAQDPCQSGWTKLTAHLGPDFPHDAPLTYAEILKSNGVDDVCWALQHCAGPDGQRLMRLFAADCAERVIHLYERDYPGDDRPRKAIQAARDFAHASDAASDAAGTAARAASDAASDAAWAAAGTAARAASDAAGTAAWAAASDAARAASDAAGTAAWAAASDASDAAWTAEINWQSCRITEYLTLGPDGVPPMLEAKDEVAA